MKDDKYFSMLVIMALTFLGIAFISYSLEIRVFITELAYMTVLLMLAGIVLYLVSRRQRYAYAAAVIFFSLMIMNITFLFFLSGAYFTPLIILLVLTGMNIFGFLFALERVGMYSRKKEPMRDIEGQLRALRDKSKIIERELKSLEEEPVKIIIEDYKPKKKKTVKSSKKRASKKGKRKSK